MVKYKLLFTKLALKDKKKLDKTNFSLKVKKLLDLIADNPFCYPPAFEKLSGDLNKYYSRRINIEHRIVYSVDEIKKEIHIIRMWTHYEGVIFKTK